MSTVIITGGSDGLGKLIADRLLASGNRVICLSRSNPSNGSIHIQTNLLDDNEIKKSTQVILEKYSDFDCIINCAGVFTSESVGSLSSQNFESCFRVNSIAPALLISNLWEKILSNNSDIVNIGSSLSFKGYKDGAAYGSSKRALRGLNENLRVELLGKPNRLIEFYPGGFQSRFFEKFTGEKSTDLSKYMKPSFLADMIVFAISLPKNIEMTQIIVNKK